MAATTLAAAATYSTSAAALSFFDASQKSAAGALKTALADFVADAIGDFPDDVISNRPVSDWFVPLQSLSESMSALTTFTQAELNQAANLVYRICWAGQAALDAGTISAPQAATLLASYNANIN